MVAEVIGVTKRIRLLGEAGGLDGLLLSAVDESLKPVFREEGTQVIYDYLENNSHLKLEEIAERPELFSVALETLMASAALVIEKLILKNLYCKLGLRFREKEGYEFSDYIKQFTQRRADTK